jgi:transposase
LFREIKPKGYPGEVTLVRLFVRQLREASGMPSKKRSQARIPLKTDPTVRPPTLRTLTWWVLKRPEDRKEAEEKLLERISRDHPKLQQTISLAREFAAMIREQQTEQLDGWLETANQSSYRVWRNFVAGLKQDESVVRAALQYHWSNGPTEGHVNRLKCLKRLMYGRAKDDLLRKRVLWQGSRPFT